jgi:mannose-6-phosphate isomerase-like protein (cupin superfamily)
MKHIQTAPHRRKDFKVLALTRSAECAIMTLKPGDSTSDKPENEHPRAEQWLYVVSGAGRAKVGRRTVTLKEGSLLLIEKREPHQITNTGRTPLVTLNFYAPPAYDLKGELLD